MSSKRYTNEFNIKSVRQVTDRGFKVAEVAQRLGFTTHRLYIWLRKFGKPGVVQRAEVDHSAEVGRLKTELRYACARSSRYRVVVQALLSAVWRRKPSAGCLVHSDQKSVYTSDDWHSFLASHGLVCSMSRPGNCHDNAPVESFFGLLKRERIRRRIYPTKDAARAEVFDYIEMFYNPQRRHG
ncbi:DDE-type integrase/transposase/recombinase [Xanthomonas melonis]|uniref:DDE-type integrase/transposase/recombinase n=1 Tax=Xanthomonas melonis TaxID=56456 RepID=A0ABS8NT19_9XANT|nr:DDE-type integrase/transposase/recombinase [Xanthomonas melonis]MCD0257995.1 DDE-type integrase/transposase/recombinase [Xanthomonas melonis]MCD0266219.1 DDE-type integrase/transposase/recombinase [Xanthomonas melonis]